MPTLKSNDAAATVPPGLKALGIVLLVVALGSALTLALDHFDLTRAPGCGPRSGCDQATRSAWGSIPLLRYPTSLVGVAFFAAALAGWIACTRGVPALFRAIIWLGGAMSVMFIIVMVSGGYLCKYCLATHIANLAFVVVMEMTIRRAGRGAARPSLAPLGIGAIVFVVGNLALATLHVQTESRRAARDEAERQATLDQLMGASTRKADGPVGVVTTTQPAENLPPFTGRWRLGPENAPIRIVMFTDYQCNDCRQMEAEAMALVQNRQDVSLSVKQFPMSNKCNPNLNVDMHANACWAARAAEAAGMLRGDEGFWEMHRWLFARKGEFTDADFPPALQQMGYDPQQFIGAMTSDATQRLVREDIDQGADLGLHFTPMVFINGVVLRGFIGNPGALTRTVEELAATNPPSASASHDHPPRAAQKYIDDWAKQAKRTIVARANPWAIGPADARVQMHVWSDYQQPLTAELDRLIKEQIAAGHSIRYEFRQYPFDQSCNRGVPQTVHPFGCMAARAAEAAGALGGNEAYWKMHDWLLAHQVPLNDNLLREAATSAGVDASAILSKMREPAIATIVASDAQNGQPYIMQGIPTLYVNGRWVPRWKLEGADIFESIVQQAERE